MMPRELTATAPGETALEELHHGRVTLRASMPAWGTRPGRRASRGHGLPADAEQELGTDGFIDPIVSFEDATEAYRLIGEHPDRCVKLGITFGQ